MTAMPERIGNYRILELIGAGGMGEVYRAHDTRLGRDVAVKVLSGVLAQDRGRHARLEREARTLAALNHPHIASILGIEESDGRAALVLELVEGPTLEDLIAHGPISVGEALRIASQIADALEAAHEKGIVHRDLKPSNIKLMADGRVKVLDFGLAKALAADDVGASTPTVTVTAGGTAEGAVVGTPAYMSPEQARGQPVDKRTDVWAFGCVLYEMLTARRAFGGATPSDAVAGILTREPELGDLSKVAPPQVTTVIAHCLAKDPRDRIRDIGDVRLLLSRTSVAGLPPAADAPSSTLPRVWPIVASVAVGSALVVGTGIWAWMRAPAPSVKRLVIDSTAAVSIGIGGLATTPTGVVFANREGSRLFLRTFDDLEPRPLTPVAASVRGPFTSPDGQSVGYVQDNTVLKTVPLSGGRPKTVLAMDGPSRGATWTRDDTIIFATSKADTGLQRVRLADGKVDVLTRPVSDKGEGDHILPEILPGGREVLFTIEPKEGSDQASSVAVLVLETGQWHTVLPEGRGAQYLASGHLLYAALGGLHVVAFDLDTLMADGPSRTVVPRFAGAAVGTSVGFRVTPGGTLVWSEVMGSPDQRSLVYVNASGQETPVPNVGAGRYEMMRLASDGTRVAVDLRTGDDSDIWVLPLGAGRHVQISREKNNDSWPVWLDDRNLVYASQRGQVDGMPNLFRQPVSGFEKAVRLLERVGNHTPTDVAPDGSIVYCEKTSQGTLDLRLLRPDSPGSGDGWSDHPLLTPTPFNECSGDVSPDGKWIVYDTDEHSDYRIFVRPFPVVDARFWEVAAGRLPRWSPNGNQIAFVSPGGSLSVLSITMTEKGPVAGTDAETLFEGRPYLTAGDGNVGANYEILKDGRFLLIKDPTENQIVVEQNWFTEELRRALSGR